jgi:hypothetical protein
MKCLACREGTLKLASYNSGSRPYGKARPKGLLVCDKCDYKEVI